MNAKEIIVGKKLEFEVIATLDSKISKTYNSQFIEIISNTEVVMSSPVEEFEAILLPSGTKIRAVFLHEIHGMLGFEGTITHIEKNEALILFHTRIDDNFTLIQRRKYFRIDHYLEAEYHLIEEVNVPYKRALIKNISYHGALIEIDENIPENSIIDLIIWLSDKPDIKMRCSIIKISESEVRGMKKYELNLSLIYMNQRDKESLKKFITRSVTC
ncbi:flagellar brake protein [Acetobacterium sp.]|uniref:flagellar brake protein n=1 Tax=Acetobacterium sp. TaxID=1872094 RepID=UPI002F42B827